MFVYLNLFNNIQYCKFVLLQKIKYIFACLVQSYRWRTKFKFIDHD